MREASSGSDPPAARKGSLTVIGKGESAMSARRAARSTFVLFLLVIAGAAGTAASGAFAAQRTGPILELSATSSRISLSARDVPLADVLTAIGRQAGVRMVLRGKLDIPVTETLVDVPIDEGIQRLTRWQSVVLVYDEPVDASEDVDLIEVWVAGATSGPDEPEGRARGVRSDDRGADTPPSVGRRRIGARAHENGSTAAGILRDTATRDPSPTVRRSALQTRARESGADRVNGLREAAIWDPEPHLRRLAIRRLASTKGAEAGDTLLGLLNDPDPQIRAAATSAFARWSSRVNR
jgi:hypothetical protein